MRHYQNAERQDGLLKSNDFEGGGKVVTLEHRDLERFGAGARRHAEKLGEPHL